MAKTVYSVLFFCLIAGLFTLTLAETETPSEEEENEEIDDEKLEYAKGSLCTYCDYCKVSL